MSESCEPVVETDKSKQVKKDLPTINDLFQEIQTEIKAKTDTNTDKGTLNMGCKYRDGVSYSLDLKTGDIDGHGFYRAGSLAWFSVFDSFCDRPDMMYGKKQAEELKEKIVNIFGEELFEKMGQYREMMHLKSELDKKKELRIAQNECLEELEELYKKDSCMKKFSFKTPIVKCYTLKGKMMCIYCHEHCVPRSVKGDYKEKTVERFNCFCNKCNN